MFVYNTLQFAQTEKTIKEIIILLYKKTFWYSYDIIIMIYECSFSFINTKHTGEGTCGWHAKNVPEHKYVMKLL